MFCDYHVHTEYSDDSCYLMEDVIRDAIVLGIKEICFTDHVDYGIKLDWDDPNLIIKENEKRSINHFCCDSHSVFAASPDHTEGSPASDARTSGKFCRRAQQRTTGIPNEYRIEK